MTLLGNVEPYKYNQQQKCLFSLRSEFFQFIDRGKSSNENKYKNLVKFQKIN